MHIDFEAHIKVVQLTLDADEIKNIANMYRDAAMQDKEDGYRHSAGSTFEKAAWYYRAIGETWYAERCDRDARSVRED